jgi:hypothetical protein
MTPEEVEAAAGLAVDDLESRLRERDAADEKPDARIFALAFIADLRGQGWRPTAARPAEPWQTQIGPPPHPETAQRGAELARKALHGKEVP